MHTNGHNAKTHVRADLGSSDLDSNEKYNYFTNYLLSKVGFPY